MRQALGLQGSYWAVLPRASPFAGMKQALGLNAACLQHFPFLGLLPAPKDGWCDITDRYVARYGVPKAGKAIWIRTGQRIDGWNDAPKAVRARILTATAQRRSPPVRSKKGREPEPTLTPRWQRRHGPSSLCAVRATGVTVARPRSILSQRHKERLRRS
jgi:hypothetical protein